MANCLLIINVFLNRLIIQFTLYSIDLCTYLFSPEQFVDSGCMVIKGVNGSGSVKSSYIGSGGSADVPGLLGSSSLACTITNIN